MKPGGLLQLLNILEWKWDDISMNFTVGWMACKFDLIWVIVDRLSKSSHFILVNTKYRVEKYVEIYIARMLCLHGVPKMIILQPRFVVCRSLLRATVRISRDSLDPQFGLSPADGWPNRMSQPNP
jgi:hypothetical protein